MLALVHPKANIFGVDIAENLITFACKQACYNGVGHRVHFEVMPAEFLRYPDDFFDVVYGVAIVHHVDIDKTSQEVKRVLKNGGRAIFVEPLGENPLLEFLRKRIPHPNKNRSPDEKPLRYSEIKKLMKPFSNRQIKEYELAAAITRVVRSQCLLNILNKMDSILFKFFPKLKRFCRIVIFEFQN
jgi:ubiquinone/menaquinone biosynthesis C-methylase UbiE